jgi:nucleoredoxin
MEAILGQTLLSKSGPVPTSSLHNVDVVLLYFSAHWCPPCRGFTPKLAAFYNEVNASGNQIEVVFVSCDNSPPEFQGYYNEMPWLAVPFENQALKSQLGTQYSVSGIPALILIDKTGRSLRTNCRNDVMGKSPQDAVNEWKQAR